MQRKTCLFITSLFLASFFFSGCVTKNKGIIYNSATGLRLDIYAPKNIKTKKEVLVFVHGGNWRSGKRSTYKFFGKGFARKGIVTVVIDYRLNKLTDYKGMSDDVAKALKWVRDSIPAFGGDTGKIFISGHSSGGHLSALVAADSRYFKALGMTSPIKGVVLIDAFGLDMYTYLKNSQNVEDSIYFPTFTKDPLEWKKGSPIYYLQKTAPPFLLFVGGRTYPAIKKYSDTFLEALRPYQPGAQLIKVKGKKHVPMIAQFYNPWNKWYQEILEFIRK